MTAFNPSGPTGYGQAAGPTNPDGTQIIDTVDTIPVLGPTFVPATGALAPAAPFNPLIPPDTAGIPGNLALLVDLRVLINLIVLQMGAQAPDLQQMRADELWNLTIGTGTI